MADTIQIAIIGTGGMAHSHARNFTGIRGVRVVACCDVVPERARDFAEKWKIPAAYTDVRKLLDHEHLDAVTIVTPDKHHAAVALAAIRRGLHVLCEKPLASTLAEARAMLRAARTRRVVHMVNFSYRDCPGLNGAAEAVLSGRLGNIRHVEAGYLQSWLVSTRWGDWRKKDAWMWRMSKAHGSAGVLGDLGSHLFDMVSWICGDISDIECRLQTFSKGVRGNRVGAYKLDANDSFVANVVFQNGALGSVRATRWAVGHHNSISLGVYGDEGAIEFDLDRANDEYRFIRGKGKIDRAEWQTVKCKHAPNVYRRFIDAIRKGRTLPADFSDGLRTQKYLHICEVSDKRRAAVKGARIITNLQRMPAGI